MSHEELCRPVIVTASAAECWDTLSERQKECVQSWNAMAHTRIPVVHVYNGRGVVPAFRQGLERAAAEYTHCNVAVLLHDDVIIKQQNWDQELIRFYEWAWALRLGVCVGFSGAYGIGRSDIYKNPYDPMQLARQSFISNLVSAESHGAREVFPRRVACCDGFSFSGPVRFLQRAFHRLDKIDEIVHHAYDTMLGLIADDHELETWFLPIYCEHFGGMTTTRPEYLEWAQAQGTSDAAIWQHAHRQFYEYGRGKLPLYIDSSARVNSPGRIMASSRGRYRSLDMQFFGGGK